jgi:Ser/Thr protein kinase RdoA (MazF antagonist)
MSDEWNSEPQGQIVSEHDIQTIMHAFGVAHWQNLGTIESVQGNAAGTLIEISGQRYFLRERPEGILGEDIQFRYTFQHYLREAGLPVPLFYTTPQGEPTVMIGEDYFELQQQVGGELFSTTSPRSLDWTASAGHMLARIHQVSRDYPGSQYHWPAEAHIGSVVQSYLDLARAKVDVMPVHAIGAALSEWVEQWEAVLPASMMSLGSQHALPELHIHGDYHPLNLRFGPFGVSAVMGFEAARWEKRLFEVAYGLFYFSAFAWLPGSGETPPLVKRGFEPERAQRFLRAYGEIEPPAPGEAAVLADALSLIAPIITINGPLEDLFYQPPELLNEMPIDDLLDRLNWSIAFPSWIGRIRHALSDMWND